ncbi:MAG: HAMP domain-containing protein [Desulfurivibrionaceae bacterium]
MHFFNFGSLNRRLALLVIFSVLPAMIVMVYSNIEQRRHSIEDAKKDVSRLTHAMAVEQQKTIIAARQILSTLSAIPEIRDLDIPRSREILTSVRRHYPQYIYMALTDLNGDVLVESGSYPDAETAGDFRHIEEALARRKFSLGEFIIPGPGDGAPVFSCASPVLDKSGQPKAVLSLGISLSGFATFDLVPTLPEKSFLAVTDHRGIRLYYYPPQQATNPIGRPINPRNWAIADRKRKPGNFMNEGSDGINRIFAFEPLRLSADEEPYMYVWAGLPETDVVAQANISLARNLFLIILSILLATFLFRIIGKRTILAPIRALVDLTEKYGRGNFEARSKFEKQSGEFGSLTKAFHNMAQTLHRTQKELRENEARFRHLMDSIDAIVYVADMDTHEVLFINAYGKKLLGDAAGKICWQTIQSGQEGPCDFCTNKDLIDENGKPVDGCTWEFKNTATGKWFHIRDRAITWPDGRIVRLEVATDITARKENELAKDALIEELEKALSEIKKLRGILPICSFCKKIRDDKGYWNQVEVYIKEHSEADFSHSLCPDCAKAHYPEYMDANGKIRKSK